MNHTHKRCKQRNERKQNKTKQARKTLPEKSLAVLDMHNIYFNIFYRNMETTLLWLCLALVAMATAAKNPLQWKSKTVNETVTAEATLEFLIKNYDDSGDLHGSIKIGLFGEKVPMTVLNFVTICNGVKRPTVSSCVL